MAASVDELKSELSRLKDRIQTLQAQSESLSRQTSGFVNLYIGIQRLTETLDRAEVLEGIKEIVMSVVGCEHLCIFEHDAHGVLLPTTVVGLSDQQVEALRSRSRAVADCVATGSVLTLEGSGAAALRADGLTSCVPLKRFERVTGVVAMGEMLQHKPFLTKEDVELLEMLSAQGGRALYCAALHTQLTSGLSAGPKEPRR